MTKITPSTSTPAAPVRLPQRVDSLFLDKHRREGEPLVVLKASGIGNTAPYEYRGHGARACILRWELKQNAHVLRIPAHLWMQEDHALAHDILDHDPLPLPLIVLLELPATTVVEKPARRTSRTATGA